jgi:hypothetical protein
MDLPHVIFGRPWSCSLQDLALKTNLSSRPERSAVEGPIRLRSGQALLFCPAVHSTVPSGLIETFSAASLGRTAVRQVLVRLAQGRLSTVLSEFSFAVGVGICPAVF